MTIFRGSPLGFGPQTHECVKNDVNREALLIDVDPEPEQLQDRSKDQGEELIKMDIIERGKNADSIYIQCSTKHKTELLELLKEYKRCFS